MIMKLEGSTAGAPKPDPIFALIAEHQAAYYGMEALYDENDEDNPLYLDAEDAELEKLKLLVVTKPETFAGLVAFAEYVVSYFATQVSWFPSEPSENALATISQVLHDFAPGGHA